MQTCATCGFLAARRFRDGLLVEAQEGFRTTRQIPVEPGYQVKLYEDVPVCFVQQTSLKQECEGKDDPATVLAVINKNRDGCSGFAKWEQGFLPKEHSEMLQAKELQAIQDRREQADRDWRACQAENDHRWRLQERRDARYQFWVNLILTVAIASVTSYLTVLSLAKPGN